MKLGSEFTRLLSANNRSITTNVIVPFFHSSSSSSSFISSDESASMLDKNVSRNNIMQKLRVMTSNKFILYGRNILNSSSGSVNNCNLNDNIIDSCYIDSNHNNNVRNNVEAVGDTGELSSGLWFGSTMKKRSVMMNKHKKKKRRKERRFNTKSSRASK